MKAVVPEIAWHNKSPVFTIDIQTNLNKDFYRAATGGGDSHVVIWRLVLREVEKETEISAEFAADLDRHIKAVNVVRFSKNGDFLASGDDDAVIILWTLKEWPNHANNSFGNDEGNKENWVSVKVLRGHKDDIYDLCWSPFSNELFSGSVDNTAIIWNVDKGNSISIVGEHSGFVQGVAWDPNNKYLATLCSDRALRIFDVDSKKMVAKVSKAKFSRTIVQESETEENCIRLFHDDTVKTFFRRLCFSPDGHLVFVPCGIFKDSENDTKPPCDVTYVFLKVKPDRPVLHLPSPDEYTVAVRCCPILFQLNPLQVNVFKLPYRVVFAVASRKSIVFYDTQQTQPFAFVTDIHYATLTDISWSSDGRLLLASSSDGYCTFIAFKNGELGTPYNTDSVPALKEKQIMDGFEDLGVKLLDDTIMNEGKSTIECNRIETLENFKQEEDCRIACGKKKIFENLKEQADDLNTCDTKGILEHFKGKDNSKTLKTPKRIVPTLISVKRKPEAVPMEVDEVLNNQDIVSNNQTPQNIKCVAKDINKESENSLTQDS